MKIRLPILMLALVPMLLSACATVTYSALEQFGVHKRDLLVKNVKDVSGAQEDVQEQFQDALERFGAVVTIEDTDLKKAYDRLNGEYDDAVDSADALRAEIRAVEVVADDLFAEWEDEIDLYTDAQLKRDSQSKLRETRARYKEVHAGMIEAEKSMDPVLNTLRNNVLFLKHNLNAQAIGSLRGTYDGLQTDIRALIARMNQSIERSNRFIQEMRAVS